MNTYFMRSMINDYNIQHQKLIYRMHDYEHNCI